MNRLLNSLAPYPFERLRELLAGVVPPAHLDLIDLSIGEPKHAAPTCVKDAMVANLDGLSSYPATAGGPALRETIARWLERRYGLDRIDALTQVLPVVGSREALFAFAQTIVDRDPHGDPTKPPIVLAPDPFYQIYEGAALLAGAQPVFVPQLPQRDFACDWAAVSAEVWSRTQLLYVCSPGNPTGRVMTIAEWQTLFDLADRFDFVIAADECYSEIWSERPPLGALEAAQALGRTDWRRLVVFSSLSKRSSVPGMRSGFVAGDAQILQRFWLYRTYHGSAMSQTVQAASIAAWQDEHHVAENRALYAEKFDAVLKVLPACISVSRPAAGFYLWAGVPSGDDLAFARELMGTCHVKVLPGSLISRTAPVAAGQSATPAPGAGRIRIALVDHVDRCVEAAQRIARFVSP
jgi:N-succinyldiaminopimelate aminotransferase